MAEQEIEVKFNLKSLGAIEQRLKSAGGTLMQPRLFEINYRFDTLNGRLSESGKVLRLRKDANIIMTFKGPSQQNQEVNDRQEIEFSVSDFAAARHLLEALGYQVVAIYEKFRTTYEIDNTEVVLDEMPFGNFIEIEGPDPETIRAVAEKLSLQWEARCTDSYMGLFRILKDKRRFNFRDLTFYNFKDIEVKPEELGVKAAD